MFISERHEPLVPFPNLPGTDKAGRVEGELALRPFGLYESDLNVDFHRTPRPFLVTQILECCTRKTSGVELSDSFFWDLTVGKRIECLLNVLASGSTSELSVTFRCLKRKCGEDLELEISIAEIAALQERAYRAEHVSIELERATLSLRRPTGGDQVAWLKGRFSDPADAQQAMVRALLADPAESSAIASALTSVDSWTAVDQAMQEHDPLVNFSVQTSCPYCEEENQYEIDLEELSLTSLRRAQLRLLASVHKLARHYHWSEEEIFAVPFWRRVSYLNLIDKERSN
jgi:hypothetical protein